MAIEERAPIETRVNQQALMQKQIFLRWENKNIQDEEFRKIMQGILEMTLPLTAFLKEGEKYLTNIEQICIQNLMRGMDKDSEEFRICIQRFEEYYVSIVDRELLDSVSNMYECIMKYVGSELGNRGEYEISDAYNRSIVEGCLRFRRTATLPSGLYGRWWNYDKRKGEGIPVKKELDDEKELNKCILISKLDKQDEKTKFYINKLKQVKERGQ